MAKEYRTGIVITGDAKGGVRAVKLTESELKKLGNTQEKGQKVQKKSRKEVDKSSTSLKAYAGKLGLVSSAATALTSIIAGVGLASVVRDTVNVTRETQAWAAAVGVANQELVASDYAVQAVGLSQGKIGDIYKDTAEKIADAYLNGGGEAADALANLNLTATDLINLSPDQQLLAIAGGLDAVGSNAAKIQILESFASDASLLLPLLDDNAEKLKALKQEAIDSGKALSEFDSAKIALLASEFQRVSAETDGLGNHITVALTPIIYGASQELHSFTDGWLDMGEMSTKAVDLAVSGVGFVLDVGQELLQWLKLSEIGWLSLGKVSVDAFIGAGQVGVDLLNAVLYPVRQVIGTIIEGYGYLIQTAADISGNAGWQEAADFALGYANAVKETRFEMGDFLELQKDIQAQLVETNQELQALVNAGAPSDELQAWLDKQREAVDNLAAANVDAAESRRELTREQGEAVKAQRELSDSAEGVAQIYEDTATSIRSSFRGAFRDLLDGTNSLADRMENIFKDMLADMATMAITKPIIIPMVSSFGGVLGVSGNAQADIIKQLGGGAVGSPDSAPGGFLQQLGGGLFGGYGGLSGQQATMLQQQTAVFGADGAVATAQAAGGTGFMASAGQALGAGFMGYMAGGVAADMFNVANPKMAQNLTAIGTMIAGPIGGVVGFAVGGLFGGKWKTQDSGLELSLAGGDLSGRSFVKEKKKGGWFSSSKYRTTYDQLDTDFQRQLQGTFDSITDNLIDMGTTFGRDLVGFYDDFSTRTTLSLKGLSAEEASSAIEEWVRSVEDEMALQMAPGLTDFSRAGESAADTLKRLTLSIESIDNVTEIINNDIAIMTSTLAAGMAEFGIALENVNQSIIDTLESISSETDITQQAALYSSLYEQIKNRYELELNVLSQLQGKIEAISAGVASMRFAVNSDIEAITGIYSIPDISRVISDIGGMAIAQAPARPDVNNGSELNGSILANNEAIQTFNSGIADLNNRLLDQQSRITEMVSDASTFDEAVNSVQRLFDEQYQPDPDGLNRHYGYSYENALEVTAERLAALPLIGLANTLEAELNALIDSRDSLVAENNNLISEQAALQQAASDALLDWNNNLAEYSISLDNQVAQLQTLRDETLRYYQAQKQLSDAMRGAAAGIGDTLDRLSLSRLSSTERVDSYLADFRSLVGDSLSATGYDLANIGSDLNQLVNPLLSEASNAFASGQQYQDIYDEVVGTLSGIESRLLSEAPADFEQSSLEALGGIDSLLAQIQGQMITADDQIISAITLSADSTVSVLEDIRDLLQGSRSTIVDGSHADGLSWVPRDGYTAKTHVGEAIIDARTMAGLRKYGVPVGGSGGVSVNNLVPILERIAHAAEQSESTLQLKVVMPDGRVLKEAVITDLKNRSRKGEVVIHAEGIA